MRKSMAAYLKQTDVSVAGVVVVPRGNQGVYGDLRICTRRVTLFVIRKEFCGND